jgi:hypothetical protein
MGFSRVVRPSELPSGASLSAAMAGIGMAVAASPNYDAVIEDTLLAVSIEGMEGDQLRELGLLTAWWGVHAPFVNADRLFELVKSGASERVSVYWAALGATRKTDPRFRRFVALTPAVEHHLLRVGGAFQLARRGEDARFVGSALRVPKGVLRERAADVLSPERLAQHHRTYRARVLMGPSYRADMWAALERDPSLAGTQLARQTYGSIATASRVKRDRALWLASAAHQS